MWIYIILNPIVKTSLNSRFHVKWNTWPEMSKPPVFCYSPTAISWRQHWEDPIGKVNLTKFLRSLRPVQGVFCLITRLSGWISSLWRKVTGIPQEFRMYISRDEALCIPAGEFLNFYEFTFPGVLGPQVLHFMPGTVVIFKKIHFSTLLRGFKIYSGTSGPRKMS
jgi:hypothetical protein